MANEIWFGVDRHPVSGRWAVYELRPDGSIAWVDQGWRDSADAEKQKLDLEMRATAEEKTNG